MLGWYHYAKSTSTGHIWTENADANSYLRNLRADWNSWRGVLFLDPFATEVDWATIEKIASFNALDTWILFPLRAISRIMPNSKNPDDISKKWAEKLTRVFGDESWRQLYYHSPQQSFLEDERHQRDPGTEGISAIYKDKLKRLFGPRHLPTSKTFMNSTNSQLCLSLCSALAIQARRTDCQEDVADYLLKADM